MRRLELPTLLADGSFSVLAADAAGIPRKRTRAQDLITVSRGIRIPAGSSAQGAAALRAYCQLDACTVLCHLTAARIWRVGLPAWADGDWRVHLARPRGGSIPKRVNVAGHRLALKPGDVVMLDGVRVTSPERTFLDLAATLPLDDLVAAGDSLVSEHGPEFPSPRAALSSIEALTRMLLQHPGARNIRRGRDALGFVRVGADSPPETHLRLAVVRGGLPEPQLNFVVWGPTGAPELWPDAAYPAFGVALQYDGVHHGEPGQHLRDIGRARTTDRLGWVEVRVSKEDLTGERPAAVGRVRRALLSRGWTPR
ncbi:hypothetical protein [Arthrobacter sp. SO3]|uniref:hypothetical protein n=1 Tax=Arthrobacter sp. SO3 TaxID=1897057 RepID=UPI001CFF7242|nr:hypothetical protein [Arthrobacter sp. SO3]MCB5290838.1 hypothetical protein [Arthrobacter sp. SO3]